MTDEELQALARQIAETIGKALALHAAALDNIATAIREHKGAPDLDGRPLSTAEALAKVAGELGRLADAVVNHTEEQFNVVRP